MRILVVASFNKGRFAPFIVEQVGALEKQGCTTGFFGLQGKGLRGYLRNLPLLKQKIKEFCPDVIHAHYGLSGLFANLQRRIPVVTTYHGSDINDKKVLPFSRIAMFLSAWNVFVSRKTLEIAGPKEKYKLLPCGIDLSDLQLTEKAEARRKMNLQADGKYILFAGAFDVEVKNAPLAKDAVALLQDIQTELLELKGYTREEVTLLMCAADAFLLTSFMEGSPQVIKEAMACGCPIVVMSGKGWLVLKAAMWQTLENQKNWQACCGKRCFSREERKDMIKSLLMALIIVKWQNNLLRYMKGR